MKSKKKLLLLAAIAVVLLLVALIALTTTAPKEDSDTSTVEIIQILESSQDISYIDVSNETGAYRIVPDLTGASSTSSAETADDATSEETEEQLWQIEELAGTPQYQTKYTDMVTLMGDLEAESQLENPKDLVEYGLDQPSASVTVQYADGTDKTVQLGIQSPGDTGGYYCKLSDSDTIYVLSSVNAEKFLRRMLDYVDLTLVPTLQTVNYDTSSDGTSSDSTEGTLEISNITITRNDLDAPVVFSNTDNQLTRNGAQLDSTLEEQLRISFSDLMADSTVAIQPSEEQLTQYGFNQPTAVISYTVSGATYTVTVGAQVEDAQTESYYIMRDGVDVVYTIGSSSLPWLTMDLAE